MRAQDGGEEWRELVRGKRWEESAEETGEDKRGQERRGCVCLERALKEIGEREREENRKEEEKMCVLESVQRTRQRYVPASR